MQRFLSLISFHLFFISITLGGGSKRILLSFINVYCLCFPLRVFTVSGFTFKYLIHFGFIFVYDVRKHSSFILLHVTVQFLQHHLLNRLYFLHCMFLHPLSKIRCP